MSPIEGFSIQGAGPQSGLLKVTFSNIIVTGKRGTPAYIKGMQSKARLVDKVIKTELTIGTRHYNKAGKLLKSLKDIIFSYAREGAVWVDYQRDRRWKLEELAKNEGIVIDGNEPDQAGAHPGL